MTEIKRRKVFAQTKFTVDSVAAVALAAGLAPPPEYTARRLLKRLARSIEEAGYSVGYSLIKNALKADRQEVSV